jgi:DNA polymerase-3 subunit epsilon
MNTTPWILLDTETNGIKAPIYAVEIGAQKMRGCQPDGEPFRRLLNHNADISPQASRVNGYTREILERDGQDPAAVYADFAAYVGGLPLVSYNLPFDLDQVLLPEWQRLGLAPIGQRGFCALELARRLLDPVPEGNCKLQTLRQFYRLPERGAHTALGDVQTVVDLLAQVLQPLAQARGISTWAEILAFTQGEWFPSVVGFGKFKGRNFREAQEDAQLHGWLEWLAESSNDRSARMGAWYLAQLQAAGAASPIAFEAQPNAQVNTNTSTAPAGQGVVLYLAPQKAELEQLIAAARSRLADLEADYTAQKHAVDVMLARLFEALRAQYQQRDRVRLRIEYQRRYLDTLLQAGDEEAEEVQQAHEQAQQQNDAEYEEQAAEAASKEDLTEEEAKEMQGIWRKLVRAFHPDRCMNDPEKREAHEWLTAEINQARDRGDIALLKEIAQDPDTHLRKHGMTTLAAIGAEDVAQLRRLFDALQQRILEVLEALNALHADPGYELQQRSAQDPEFFTQAVASHHHALEQEIAELEQKAARLDGEIEDLTGAVM